jgi:hypothetical protein
MAADSPTLALGEALATSLLMPALLLKLTQRGILPIEDVVHILDTALLVLETHRQAPGGSPSTEAIDHARARLEAMLAHYSPKRD